MKCSIGLTTAITAMTPQTLWNWRKTDMKRIEEVINMLKNYDPDSLIRDCVVNSLEIDIRFNGIADRECQNKCTDTDIAIGTCLCYDWAEHLHETGD
jgi:hypothetical protein